MKEKIANQFGNKVRVRVCGLFVENEKLLLVEHSELNGNNGFWAPPGGGVEFGESIEGALVREIKEETGLEIREYEFMCVSEHVNPPLHAVEIFFFVKKAEGKMGIGHDPEFNKGDQIIKNVRFVTFEELKIMDKEQKHKILHDLTSFGDLLKKKGFID